MIYASGMSDFDYICVSAGEQPRDCWQRTLSSWFLIACGQLVVVWERRFAARLNGLVSAPQEGLLRLADAMAHALDFN